MINKCTDNEKEMGEIPLDVATFIGNGKKEQIESKSTESGTITSVHLNWIHNSYFHRCFV